MEEDEGEARQRLMERGTIKGEGGKVAEEAGGAAGTAGGTASLRQQQFRALLKFIYWFSVWADQMCVCLCVCL